MYYPNHLCRLTCVLKISIGVMVMKLQLYLTKYIYKSKIEKNFTYFVDIKLKEIVILTNCYKTYVDKYDIKKYKVSTKPNPITGGYYLKFYIVCKSENNIIKFFKEV